MTTEKMNIRAALKEKKILDSRIQKLSSEMTMVYVCSTLNPHIGLATPEETSDSIREKWQSLNDLIKRREAINRAVMEANAVTKITVAPFISFAELGSYDATEEISLATAINRKTYYIETLRVIISSLQSRVNRDIRTANDSIGKIQGDINDAISKRFAGQTNISQASVKTVTEEETERMKPIVINPLKAESLLSPILEKVEDYIQTIDNKLSEATETTFLDITY